jgi:uncharacterized protein YhfF
MTDRAQLYWQEFLACLPADRERPTHCAGAFAFGFDAVDASEIAELVRSGAKTATGSLLWAYEADGEPVPQVGDHWIVEDGRGEPACVIRTTDVAILPFSEVPESYALHGGEGDRTLATWRPLYWRYIVLECARIGREPCERAPLVMERFEVASA